MPPPSPASPSLVTRVWHTWKSLNLPWRKQFLKGSDLSGNTFWEFRDALNANRMRRIVKHAKGRHVSYSDVKISPQWHQWLRHTRDEPPTLPEQHAEIARQGRMRQLAAEADERWKSVPSFLDKPRTAAAPQLESSSQSVQQPESPFQSPTLTPDRPTLPEVGSSEETRTEPISPTGGKPEEEVTGEKKKDAYSFKPKKARKENPFDKALPKGNAGENWQPEGWTPGVAPRRGGG
ncbi:unnamed protein product [Zymoseptoria tritici ST99CH_1A5]|uniref:Uncharacterized protein n=2 Tax=Zymoseptoria tritici TaxID=1047171 RepID=A0A2H1GBN9_ZYMTR|nr:unnamed protein product [Zymoseptoria tritici ST99CH_1E4]SMR51914.1 unnamed protein product [Zymoseptoria tritici ST99CH_3D1]SMY23668.1 unnamed protein product [Zymoseptoria tritici ST99CH_1A5]